MNLLQLFQKKSARAVTRPVLHPDRAWLILLTISSCVFLFTAFRGFTAFRDVQSPQSQDVSGGKVLSSSEFLPVFVEFSKKEGLFSQRLDIRPDILDPGR